MTKQCLSVLIGVYIAISASAQCNYTVELGNAQNACSGANVTLNAAVSGASGSVSYVWQLIGGGAVGSNNSNYSFTISSANDGAYVVTTTVGTCMAVTDTVNINMYQGSPGAISGSLLLCPGANPPIFSSTSAASDVGANSIVYQWQSSTNNITWNNINSANNESYDSGPIANTLIYFRRVATFSYAGGNTCQAISNVITLQEVSAVIDINNTINQCVVAGTNLVLNTTFTSTPNNLNQTYSWTGPNGFSSSTLSPTISNYSANVSGTYTVSTTLPNVYNSSNNGQCTVQDNITLNLQPSISNYSISSPTCVGSNTNITGFSPQAGVSYAWHPANNSNITFSGGSTSSPVINFGTNASGLYQVYVVATAGSGSNTCTVQSATQTINVPTVYFEMPGVSLNGNYMNTTVINGIVTFKICSGFSNNIIDIDNIMFNYPTIANPVGTTYTIAWGNNASQAITSSMNYGITYGNNFFTLTASYNGCSQTQTYNVYSGSNPAVAGGISSGNSEGLCLGDQVTFSINPINYLNQLNSPGTTYSIYFSDALADTIDYIDLQEITYVSHTYNSSSCGASSIGIPANVFYATVVAQNTCSQSFSNVFPITVNSLPTANFSISDSTVCINQTVTVTNTGIAGSVIGSGPNYTCTPQGKFYWTISGVDIYGNALNSSAWTLGASQILGFSNTNYGSTNSNGSQILNVTFLIAGYYTISQIYYNSCGSKTKIRNICVINPPACSFTLNNNSGCAILNVSSTNTSIAPTCNTSPIPLSYAWSVSNPTGGTSSVSSATQINSNFSLTNSTNNILTYTVNLIVSPIDPANNQAYSIPNCTSTCSQTVTVFPIVNFTSLNGATLCSGGTLGLNLTTNVPATYSWVATPNPNVTGESISPQNGGTINDQLVNTSNSIQTITYTVTATSTLAFGLCTKVETVTVTLNSVTPGVIGSNQ